MGENLPAPTLAGTCARSLTQPLRGTVTEKQRKGVAYTLVVTNGSMTRELLFWDIFPPFSCFFSHLRLGLRFYAPCGMQKEVRCTAVASNSQGPSMLTSTNTVLICFRSVSKQ